MRVNAISSSGVGGDVLDETLVYDARKDVILCSFELSWDCEMGGIYMLINGRNVNFLHYIIIELQRCFCAQKIPQLKGIF